MSQGRSHRPADQDKEPQPSKKTESADPHAPGEISRARGSGGLCFGGSSSQNPYPERVRVTLEQPLPGLTAASRARAGTGLCRGSRAEQGARPWAELKGGPWPRCAGMDGGQAGWRPGRLRARGRTPLPGFSR